MFQAFLLVEEVEDVVDSVVVWVTHIMDIHQCTVTVEEGKFIVYLMHYCMIDSYYLLVVEEEVLIIHLIKNNIYSNLFSFFTPFFIYL
jgi:hypothetical protein